jgi:YD repeat-containing protein
MTTLTYLPLVGVTSSTDAKGKTVFYEYDSFFRLKNIKDQRGNILENYEYHFKP